MDLQHGKLDVRLHRIPTQFFRHLVPYSLWHICTNTTSSLNQDLYVTIVLFQFFFGKRETRLAFECNLFQSLDPQEMSLNMNMNKILPVKFSGVSPNLNIKLVTSSPSCNVLHPGKYSTRIPLAHHQICQSFGWTRFQPPLICIPMQCVLGGSRVSSQSIIQKLKTRRHLCFQDW